MTRILITTLLTVCLALTASATEAKATTTKKTTSTSKKTTSTTTAKKSASKTAAKPLDYKKLLDPSKLTAKAPELFTVHFDTSKGTFDVEVHRAWSPNGADRFYNLVTNGFFDNERFFRVISGFMVQFGINGDPAVNTAWKDAVIADDAVTQTNAPGMVSFATRGPGTRTTQLFINYGSNGRLDGMGFSPFAKVVAGMEVVNALYSAYGEGAPGGNGPAQDRIQSEGNKYLTSEFSKLDFIRTARLVKK